MGKKFFLVLAICAFCTAIKAQSPVAYDGKTLNKGDTLTIGYHSVTSSDYIAIREKIINQYGREQYLNIKDDMTFSKVRIVDLITPQNPVIFPNKNLIVLARDENRNKDLYIEIDRAIEKGEVVGQLPDTAKEAVFLSDDLLMACLLRVNKIPITDNVLLAFISVNDKELYRRCLSDEFELNKAKPRYTELLNKLMSEFDFSATYYIKTSLEMNKYDFSANAYPLGLFPKENSMAGTSLTYGDYYFIVEKNREHYRMLPVSPEKAESANKRRKGTGTYGYISPSVYGKFYLKLLDRRMELPKNDIINMENVYRHRVVGVELTGLEVYDFPHCEYNFIGSVD